MSFLRALCSRATRRRHLASFDKNLSILDFVVVLEQSTLRRSRCPRTILVVRASVTAAHKEARLRKPAHRASQVRTVDGKNLENLIVNVPNPARDVAGLTIPGIDHGIAIRGEPSLAGRKLLQPTEREPRLVAELFFARHRRKEKTHDRHRQRSADDAVENNPYFHEHRASRHSFFFTHRRPPLSRSVEEIGYGWPGNCFR